LGGRPVASSAWSTAVPTRPAASCLAEMFTHMTKPSRISPSLSQVAVCAHASRNTKSPSGRISPVASAIGMKSLGGTLPRDFDSQRRSASTPTTRRLSTSISGW
jgi:hypothetical protein